MLVDADTKNIIRATQVYLVQHALDTLDFILGIVSTFFHTALCSFQVDLSIPEAKATDKQENKIDSIQYIPLPFLIVCIFL